MDILQLEKPLQEIHNRIAELELIGRHPASAAPVKSSTAKDINAEIQALEQQFKTMAGQIFSDLTPYQVVKLSRHPNRPYLLDIVHHTCTDFVEIHGDRNFMDDKAIVTGIAQFRGHRVVIIGHQKGRGTKENMKRNFGMPRPEGYRKALRVMNMAERFGLPILTFIDTPGAYPGIDSEERGQSEAIAKNILVMSRLSVPIISVVVGEGGSGGALAIGVANRILMMEYATYSVISPEGCASILWKDGSQADRAAKALGLTAPVALKNGIIDEIIQEPLGGAHWKPQEAVNNMAQVIEKHLQKLLKMSREELRQDRIRKFFKMGEVKVAPAISPFRRENAVRKEWEESWDSVHASLGL